MQEGDGLEVLLKQILGLPLATSKPNASASTKPSASVSEPKKAQDKGVLDLQKYFEHLSEPNGFSLDQLRQPASQATPADESLGYHLLQEFSKLLVPSDQPSASSRSSRPAQDVAKQVPLEASAFVSAAPNVPSNIPAQSLKEQLEARLNNEFHSEVRDTIQAIFESLRDADNRGLSASTSFEEATSSNSKGKAKAESTTQTSAPSPNPTSKNVVDSFNEVRSIEAAFYGLQADFTFPATLDFISSHLIPGNPVTSDSERSSSTTHLAHTSRNHSVRFYEQALSSLLAQLDSVDSFGNDDLRATRKEVVSMVEKALEELEKEVEGRFRTRLAKEAKSVPIETATAPEVSTTITSVDSDLKEKLTSAPEPMVEDLKESPFTPSVSIEPAPTLTSNSPLEISEPSEISGPLTHQPKPAAPVSIPCIADALSLSSSSATVNGSEVQAQDSAQVPSPSVENESPNAFLLNTEPEVIPKRPNNKDRDDVASDWSEVEA
ncbi:hypothetical protein C0992_010479 [Termitomyces sp. T32_za158]|nr:hypothetical protein C0992_012499 [Termitomyces sp. T32_za158]KAG6896074.1 hypothetical protein C0992_010479 [Termitomyces sp. T32_za158]